MRVLQQDDELRVGLRVIALRVHRLADHQTSIVAVSDALKAVHQCRSIGGANGQLPVADDHLAHMLHQQVALVVLGTVTEDRSKALCLAVAVDTGYPAGDMIREQRCTMAFEIACGKSIRRLAVCDDRPGVSDIVAEALAAAGGVDRSHRAAMTVLQQTLQDAARYEPGTTHPFATE